MVFLDVFVAGLDVFAAVLRLVAMSFSYVVWMMIFLHLILANGKSDSPLIGSANDGLLRSNVDRLSLQPSITSMPIGQFKELAFS